MPQLHSKIVAMLSGRAATITVIILAIATRALHLLYFFNLRSDLSFQFLGTQNLLSGHGISIAQASAADISEVIYRPIIEWPPGFSVLAAPFYVLFDGNYILTGVWLQLLAAVLLLFSTRSILRSLDMPVHLINLHSLVTSFFIYSFYFICCSDAIAISCAVFAVSQSLLFLKKKTAAPWRVLLLSAFLVLAASIKYLFIPVVFAFPAFFYIKGAAAGQESLQKAAVLCFRLMAFSIAILLFYQKFAGGSPVYISEPERGWYPENLLAAFPFLPASLLKPETAEMLLPFLRPASLRIWQLAHCIALVPILVVSIPKMRRDSLRNLGTASGFFQLSFLLTAIIVLLLTSLSLVVAKENSNTWTYIQEARYYGLVAVLIHLAVFRFLARPGQHRAARLLLLLAMALLLVEACRGLVFTARRVVLLGKEEYSWQFENRFQQYAAGVISREQEGRGQNSVIVAGNSYYMNNRIALHAKAAVLADLSVLSFHKIPASRPVLLLVVVDQKKADGLEALLERAKAGKKGQFEHYSFYTLHVNP